MGHSQPHVMQMPCPLHCGSLASALSLVLLTLLLRAKPSSVWGSLLTQCSLPVLLVVLGVTPGGAWVQTCYR